MRDKLIELVEKMPWKIVQDYNGCRMNNFELVDYLLTNDIVKVVRCKNCRLSSEPTVVSRLDLYCNNYDVRFCEKDQKLVCGTHFCSYGAKMDEKDE